MLLSYIGGVVVIWQMLSDMVRYHFQLLHRAVLLPMADFVAIDSVIWLVLLPEW